MPKLIMIEINRNEANVGMSGVCDYEIQLAIKALKRELQRNRIQRQIAKLEKTPEGRAYLDRLRFRRTSEVSKEEGGVEIAPGLIMNTGNGGGKDNG